MGDTAHGPVIRGAWIKWVRYVVQPRTQIIDLLDRTAMTEKEWNRFNPRHQVSKPLRAGDEVWIVDPIETCEMNKGDLFRFAEGVSLHFFNYDCEQIYSSFKPLRAFTKALQK